MYYCLGIVPIENKPRQVAVHIAVKNQKQINSVAYALIVAKMATNGFVNQSKDKRNCVI